MVMEGEVEWSLEHGESERNRNYLGTVTSKAAANCGWWIEGLVLSRLPLLIPLRSLPHWTKVLLTSRRRIFRNSRPNDFMERFAPFPR
ncbi:hypothetical protein HZH66_006006 [Vespula vulgaris]|uniref:Uncharacterized protein n=1 Tax=Vespula vulgaris TaxID=7454 RepID=A0A834K635_VESVU|nr:hypothetical protein HZH66_006006 [Vespula vulgaris]